MVAPQSCKTRAVAAVRARQQDGGLEDEVGGQVAGGAQATEGGQDAEIGDQKGANPVREASSDLRNALIDARAASGDASDGRGGERLAAGIPCPARAEKERHLDSVLPAELSHLVELDVRQHHHP